MSGNPADNYRKLDLPQGTEPQYPMRGVPTNNSSVFLAISGTYIPSPSLPPQDDINIVSEYELNHTQSQSEFSKSNLVIAPYKEGREKKG